MGLTYLAREVDGEGGLPPFATRLDLATVRLGDLAHDEQSEPQPLSSFVRRSFREAAAQRVEHPLELRRIEVSTVAHCEEHLQRIATNGHMDRQVRRPMPDRVRE